MMHNRCYINGNDNIYTFNFAIYKSMYSAGLVVLVMKTVLFDFACAYLVSKETLSIRSGYCIYLITIFIFGNYNAKVERA